MEGHEEEAVAGADVEARDECHLPKLAPRGFLSPLFHSTQDYRPRLTPPQIG